MGDPSEKYSGARQTPRKAGRRGFSEDVQERVVAAALEAMETMGIEGVKARLIAKAAEVSVGSVYNMFGDLDQLVRHINGRTYDQLFAIVSGSLERARRLSDDPEKHMLALANSYLSFVRDHHKLWNATLSFNRAQTDPAPDWYRAKELSLITVIEDAISPFPKIDTDERRLLHARALWASIHGVVTVGIAGDILHQPADEIREQIAIIVKAVATALRE